MVENIKNITKYYFLIMTRAKSFRLTFYLLI